MNQYDQTFDLKINVGHYDRQLTIRWQIKHFTVIYSAANIFFFNLKINVVTMTYIPWSSDFALYLEDCLMHEHYYLGL